MFDTKFMGFVAGLDDTAVHPTDIATATKCHRQIELLAYDLERQGNTLAAKRLNAVQKGTPDEHRACAEGDSLEHVLARTDAAVEEDLHDVHSRVQGLDHIHDGH